MQPDSGSLQFQGPSCGGTHIQNAFRRDVARTVTRFLITRNQSASPGLQEYTLLVVSSTLHNHRTESIQVGRDLNPLAVNSSLQSAHWRWRSAPICAQLRQASFWHLHSFQPTSFRQISLFQGARYVLASMGAVVLCTACAAVLHVHVPVLAMQPDHNQPSS